MPSLSDGESIQVHHHRVEHRKVEPTTSEERELLADAGLFYATGLGYGPEIIGTKMRPYDFGHWNERGGNTTLVTKGGETWCGHNIPTDSRAFQEVLRVLKITKKKIFVHPIRSFDVGDVLERQLEVKRNLASPEPSKPAQRASGTMVEHGSCGGIIVHQGGQTRCTVCGVLRCGN